MNRRGSDGCVFWVTVAAGCFATSLPGCKPPPPVPQAPAAANPAATNPAAANSGAANSPPQTASSETTPASAAQDELPAKVVENLEQLIKLTVEYNARAEKITDRQTYIDQSGSLSELELELSSYVEYMESVEATLTPAQQAALDRQYVARAKPLIEAKRQHRMRLLSLVQ